MADIAKLKELMSQLSEMANTVIIRFDSEPNNANMIIDYMDEELERISYEIDTTIFPARATVNNVNRCET